MKKYSKKILAIAMIVAMSILCMTGCSKKEKAVLNKKNSQEVQGDFFKYRIHDKYKMQSDGHSGKMYIGEDFVTIAVMEDAKAYCSPEEYKNFKKREASDVGGMNKNDIMGSVEERENGYAYVSTYVESGDYYYRYDNVIYDCRAITFVTVAPKGVAGTAVKDLSEIVDTVEFTSTVSHPTETNYPYTVTSPDFKITINENLFTPIDGTFSDGVSEYKAKTSKEDDVAVFLYGVSTYESCRLSSFTINKAENKASAKEYADEKLEKNIESSLRTDETMEETTFGAVWPEIDASMKDIVVYDLYCKLKLDDIESVGLGSMIMHSYIFEYQGNVYSANILCFEKEQENLKELLYNVMYGVEFL